MTLTSPLKVTRSLNTAELETVVISAMGLASDFMSSQSKYQGTKNPEETTLPATAAN